MLTFLIKTLFILNTMFNQNFQILSKPELVKILETNSIEFADFNYQLEGNCANVYILKDSTIILYPNTTEICNGFLLNNINVLEEMVLNDYFPIEVPRKSELELYTKELKDLKSNIDFFKKLLCDEKKFIPYIDKELDFENIYNIIIKNKKTSKNTKIAFSILLTNNIKSKLNNRDFKWVVQKQYGVFNPYYKPHIYNENTKTFCSPFESILSAIKYKIDYDLMLAIASKKITKPDGLKFKYFKIMDE